MALSINISDRSNSLSSSGSLRNKNEIKDFRPDIRLKDNAPKRKRSKKLIVLIALLLIAVIGLLSAQKLLDLSSEMGLKISAGDFINPVIKDPQLKKDKNGNRTNILLVGLDTRETDHGLQNTDTMIVGSYSHDDHTFTMFSIPRDTYLEQPGNANWFVKSNGIYNQVESREEGQGLNVLKKTIEDYVGFEIQYYGLVDIQGFKNVIDILGGVEVYVENSFTDYAYPDESGTSTYKVVSFQKGLQLMDGDTATKYVRSRKSLDSGEGSDFARARRQQQVIKAIHKKVLSTETLLNPKKIIELLAEVQGNIKLSEFTNEDIQAAISIINKDADLEIYSFVLDPNIGSRQILTEGVIPDAYSIGPTLGLGEYDDLHDIVQRILKDPVFYTQDPTIFTYDIGAGFIAAAERSEELSKKYPYTTIIYQGTLYTDKSSDYVYDNSTDGTYGNSIKKIAQLLTKPILTKPDFITNRLNGEDVVVLFGSGITEDQNEVE